MSSVLVLIGLAFFFALGLEPAASWLVNRKLPRWVAVTLVVVVTFTLIAGLAAAAIPPLVQQAHQFIEQAPHYLQQARDHSSLIGRLNERFHLQQRITEAVDGSGAVTFSGLEKAGLTVFGALSDVGVVAVLTLSAEHIQLLENLGDWTWNTRADKWGSSDPSVGWVLM